VPFVLWFNFLAGLIYILAGWAIWTRAQWATPLALTLCVATLLVAAAFGWHVAHGGAYEPRTIGALIFRAGFWASATALLWHWQRQSGQPLK
jgi:hypothetical protein